MKFGTFFFFQWPPHMEPAQVIHNELEQMDWTEELGFDQIWLTEHHFIEYGLSVDPPTIAAAAAMRTKRVRIGMAAAILPFHEPIRLAEQTALVDIMSHGRLDVGVGRGSRPSEFKGYRVSQLESRERFEEVLEVLQRAWRDEPCRFDGKYFQIPGVRVIPKPVQKPHPPLYGVAVGAETIQATAQRGFGMLNSVLTGSPKVLEDNRDIYVAALQQAGKTAAEVAALLARWGVSRHIYVAPTDAQALAEAKEAELWYQGALKRFMLPENMDDVPPELRDRFRAVEERMSKVTWEGLVAETLIFGAPDTVCRHIEYMRDIGVGQVLCWMNFGGLPQQNIRRSMELFATEVMPHFP